MAQANPLKPPGSLPKARPGEEARPRPSVPVGPDLVSILAVAYRARRAVLLEGPTGIGKSEVIQQVARSLGIDTVVLDLSLLEPSDLVGLPVLSEGRTRYALPSALPTSGSGILFLEELNRAERYVQQPALQLLTARRLHDYVLPDGWVTMAAINPDEGEYQVTPLDPALRARFLNLSVRADRLGWLGWAEAHGVHRSVLQLARTHDQIVDEVPPRTWTYVSQVLHALTPDETRDEVLLRHLLGGYLPPAWVTILMADRAEWGDPLAVDPYRLVATYASDAKLQRTVRGFIRGGRTDCLDRIADRVLGIVSGPEVGRLSAEGQFDLASFEALLADLPGDHREVLQDAFGENPLATSLVGLDPKKVLDLEASGAGKLVRAWSGNPLLRHRVRSVITALCIHLERAGQVPAIRQSLGNRIALGQFLDLVGTEMAAPLRDALRRFLIEPVEKRR